MSDVYKKCKGCEVEYFEEYLDTDGFCEDCAEMKCPVCKGTGEVRPKNWGKPSCKSDVQQCGHCKGSGII